MATDRLAIHGGEPVRPTARRARVQVSAAVKAEIMEVLDSGVLARFYGGRRVQQFERDFAAWFGRGRCIAVNSGTSALHAAYVAADVPEYSEVLLPANAYVSAFSALVQARLVPVLVDIDAKSWVMDPADLRRKITNRSKGIVPVHMYGQPCDMTAICDLAEHHGLQVIEDCGQSHGGQWDNRLLGTFGRAACFSICCRKHVTSGEGGAVITDDETMADRALSLAHKGKGPDDWFDYREMGYSYNMTEIQAVLALHGLENLQNELDKRLRYSAFLRETLADLEIEFPDIPDGAKHAFFKCNFILSERLGLWRNEIVKAIACENVGAEPSHPYLVDIPWIRRKSPGFLRELDDEAGCSYEPEQCPRARSILKRQIGIELGPGLEFSDIEFAAVGIRRVVEWYSANCESLQVPQSRFC